ncbi:RlpA-like double-psi beta-barrel-protein domain-containing protein-containing protein [Boletus coccyginus]|nr:RlpA-like double-psi beta-barrel-protein domain-containing protein-containing protein [Boletus coccyginus]
MHPFSVIFTVLSIFFLSVLAAPLPLDQSLAKRSSGQGTWFYDGLGACGYTNSGSDPIVAISSQIYGSGGYCNKWVSITSNGKTVSAQVRDECPGCGPGDLDMSIGLFEQFAALSVGVLSITWSFT